MACLAWYATKSSPDHALHAGDGFSARAEDSVLHGCIPVVVAMDNVHAAFEGALDWSKFGVR